MANDSQVGAVPSIALIAAVADNGVIGRDNQLPWRLPADLQHFKRLTLNKPLIFGRKTYESLGKPLPGRQLIVVSSRAMAGPEVAHAASLAAAIDQARQRTDGAEILIGGGAQIYAQALLLVDRLYLTRVHGTPKGDAYFPPWDPTAWQCIDDQPHPADERHEFGFSFQTFVRRPVVGTP